MLEVVKEAARKAGDFLYAHFGKVNKIVSKGDRNLATDLDRKAERIIVEILSREFPSSGILGEEETKINPDSDSLWIIDPLDGTHNFIHNIDIFGVSIGLWDKKKEDFVLGVVYIPKEKQMYSAQKGRGAFRNGERIFVSGVSDLRKASGSFDSSIRYAPSLMLGVLGRIAEKCFNIRMFGSSARTLTYIAEGKLDFAIEFHDRPWDFAGSVCIIKEARGVIFDLKGEAVTPKSIGYVTSPLELYPRIKEILDSCLDFSRNSFLT